MFCRSSSGAQFTGASARVPSDSAGAFAAFTASMAATRRRRSSWPICSPESPVRSSAVSTMAAAASRAAAKKLALRVAALFEALAAARVRLAGQQEIRETLGPAQRVAAFERLQHRVGAQLERAVHVRVIPRRHDARARAGG